MRAARLSALFALPLTLLLSTATPTHHVAAASAAYDCEGDACAQVTITFDEAKQQYRAQNSSADRWAKVSASNLAGTASACIEPGKAEYLPLKSIVGTYRAEYTEARCGATGTD